MVVQFKRVDYVIFHSTLGMRLQENKQQQGDRTGVTNCVIKLMNGMLPPAYVRF
jgi:hypothetical protein